MGESKTLFNTDLSRKSSNTDNDTSKEHSMKCQEEKSNISLPASMMIFSSDNFVKSETNNANDINYSTDLDDLLSINLEF